MDIKIDPPVTVRSNGTSLWRDSKGNKPPVKTYKIDMIVLKHYTLADYCGTLDVFGPNIKNWFQYTDKQIEKDIIKLAPYIENATGKKIKSMSWSEQGMQ